MFYIGVVEANIDPLKMGRLRVRVFGVHTENRKTPDISKWLLPDDLPWCYPAMPITNSNINGISDFSGEIVLGTRVMVFFLDKFKQKPFYFAVLPFVLDEMPDFENGFTDPSGSLPTEDFINESSISRLARNEKIEETCIQDRKDNKTTWTCNEIEIEEPESSYAAEYPYNRVIQTPSGIVIELDSTDGAERVHIYHPSGSFVETQADGTKIEKNTGNHFDITLSDKYLYVGGDINVKVDGNATIDVDGNAIMNVNGSSAVNLVGQSTIHSEAELAISSTSKATVSSTADVDIIAGGTASVSATKVEIDSLSDVSVTALGKVTILAATALELTGVDTKLTALGSLTISSTSVVNITAPLVSLN